MIGTSEEIKKNHLFSSYSCSGNLQIPQSVKVFVLLFLHCTSAVHCKVWVGLSRLFPVVFLSFPFMALFVRLWDGNHFGPN